MTPEGRVKEGVRRVLQTMNAWFFMPVPSGRGVGGVPDFIACVPQKITSEMVGQTIGVFVAIETKAPGKLHTLTPLQKRQIEAIRTAHGHAFVVTDATEVLVPEPGREIHGQCEADCLTR